MKSKNVVDNKGEMKKSIVIFYHRDPTNSHRGQGRYLMNLQRTLSTRSHTSVIGNYSDSSKKRQSAVNGLLNNMIHSYLNMVKFTMHFLASKKNRGHTIFISEDIYALPLVFCISEVFGVKLLYRASDFGKDYRKSIAANFRVSWFIYAISSLAERIAIRFSDYFIVPSLALKEKLLNSSSNLNEANILYFPYVARPAPPKQEEIKQFKLKNGINEKFLLVFIGPADYPPNVKAITTIISLARELEEDYSQIFFIIAGRGTEQYDKSAAKNVMFMGEVEDLDTLFYACHIGLTPVDTPGGLSMKTVDYLVHGLTVVSTDEGAFGIPKNGQMIISRLSDFKSTIQKLYRDFNNGRMTAMKVSKEVEEYFLSNLDEIIFLDKIDDILREPSR